MFLKLTYIIKPIHLAQYDKLSFSVPYNEQTISITIEKIPEEKRIPAFGKNDLFASAMIEIELSEKKKKQFAAISSPLSNAIKDFIDPIQTTLYEHILSTIKICRWRFDNDSFYELIRFYGGYAYSEDGVQWKIFPDQLTMMIEFDRPLSKEYTSTEIESVQTLLSQEQHEPIRHELLQEAWELRKHNPRSSLVIGLAAVETGFKQFSSQLVPYTSWMIQNAPSPPLVDMLREMIPSLPVKNKIYGKALPPPTEALNILKKGVTLRNQIVHGKNPTLQKDTVEEILNTVRDTLYLLDFYNGHTWAWSHINSATTHLLVADSKK